jgi:hypothetical protein
MSSGADFQDLTLAAGGSLSTIGATIRVAGTLDLSEAGPLAICFFNPIGAGYNSFDAVGPEPGSGYGPLYNFPLSTAGFGGYGYSGGVPNQSPASTPPCTNVCLGGTNYGGLFGQGGGAESGTVRGMPGTQGAQPYYQGWMEPGPFFLSSFSCPDMSFVSNSSNSLALGGGAASPAGAGGATDNSGNLGGAGGASAPGTGNILIYANKIKISPATSASAISTNAIGGGNGSDASGGNAGGGGGGGGGNAGAIIIFYNELIGSCSNDILDTTGGRGGNGGLGSGTGTEGSGALAGSPGGIFIIKLGDSTGSGSLYIPPRLYYDAAVYPIDQNGVAPTPSRYPWPTTASSVPVTFSQ